MREDVSAKDGSQETAVNFLALLLGLVLIPAVDGNKVVIWLLFILFTAIHIFANYKAVTSLQLPSFNVYGANRFSCCSVLMCTTASG